MSTRILFMLLLVSTSTNATVLLDEDFSSGTLPPDFTVVSGSATVIDEALQLSSGACLELPSTYSRLRDLELEVDINITWQAAGDFNVQALYDEIIPSPVHCLPLTDGYLVGVYPAGSDNPQNLLQEKVNGTWSGHLVSSPSVVTANQWAHFKLVIKADGTVRAFVDGLEILSAVTSNVQEGRISLRAWGTVWIDNLKLAETGVTCTDDDNDGYGAPGDASCPGGPETDCDDADVLIFPGALEDCNGVDDNCDGAIDEGFDQDQDGFTTCSNDCDDVDPAVNPDAAEICDNIDNNCDGSTDEGFDADGDEVAECFDNCPFVPNTDQIDTDGDVAGDVCDACPLDPDNDTDGDGICGDVDNCPATFNPSQEDFDNDGLGDVCDSDDDNDEVLDGADVCPFTVFPEATVPSERLGTNRFALTDGDTAFDTSDPTGIGPEKSFSMDDTAGCSCEQIITELGIGPGHVKFGCSISAIEEWIALVGD